jgi:predicted DNA-binding antitoxin AbrB/MazE fold protein
MTTTIRAVYQGGVFKPLDPLAIADGAAVELVVTTESPAAKAGGIADALAAIAGLPLEGPDDGFSGARHDEILYPKPRP